MLPPRGTPANIHICLIFLEIRIIDLQFAGDSMCLGSLTFSGGLRKTILFPQECVSAKYPPTPLLGPILHRFGDIAGFCAHDPTPIPPYFGGCSRWNRSPLLGSMWTGTLSYIFSREIIQCTCIPTCVKIILQRHRQVGRRTDDFLWHNRALRSIAW